MMFIELVYGDTTEFIAVDAIALVEKTPEADFPYAVVLKTGHIKQLSQSLYDQIYAVLHKPSEVSLLVGEPLREIVSEAWGSKEGGLK